MRVLAANLGIPVVNAPIGNLDKPYKFIHCSVLLQQHKVIALLEAIVLVRLTRSFAWKVKLTRFISLPLVNFGVLHVCEVRILHPFFSPVGLTFFGTRANLIILHFCKVQSSFVFHLNNN